MSDDAPIADEPQVEAPAAEPAPAEEAEAVAPTTFVQQTPPTLDSLFHDFVVSLYGSPVAQSTEAWNHLMGRLPELQEAIRSL